MDFMLNLSFPALQWTCARDPWGPYCKRISWVSPFDCWWGPFSKIGFSKLSFPESCQKNSLEFHHAKSCQIMWINQQKQIDRMKSDAFFHVLKTNCFRDAMIFFIFRFRLYPPFFFTLKKEWSFYFYRTFV